METVITYYHREEETESSIDDGEEMESMIESSITEWSTELL